MLVIYIHMYVIYTYICIYMYVYILMIWHNITIAIRTSTLPPAAPKGDK